MINNDSNYNFDPLSAVTRKERKLLLSISLLALVISKLNLYPTEITISPFKFEQIKDAHIIIPNVLRMIIVYLLCGYAIYGRTDFMAWKLRIHEARKYAFYHPDSRPGGLTPEQEREFEIITNPPFKKSITTMHWLRGFFEFAVPILFALYILYAI